MMIFLLFLGKSPTYRATKADLIGPDGRGKKTENNKMHKLRPQ